MNIGLPSSRGQWPLLLRYGMVLLSVALAAGVKLSLVPVLGLAESPFLTFLAAVMVCAWFGGRGPGFAAVALSACVVERLFWPPHSLSLQGLLPFSAPLGLFLVEGALVAGFLGSLRRPLLSMRERERLQERDRLGEQQEWFGVTLANIGEAVMTTDAQGRVHYMNPVAEALTGWTLEEARDKDCREILHILDQTTGQPIDSPLDRIARDGTIVGMGNHSVLLSRTGRRVPIDDNGAPIRNGRGEVIGTVLIFRDIEERKRIEDALHESEERFHLMADGAPVLLWLSDATGLGTFFNQHWLEFVGQSLEQHLGRGWTNSIHPDDLPACLEAYYGAYQLRQPFIMEYRRLRYDGQYRWMIDRGVPRHSPSGVFEGYIGSCVDITERRQAEEERLHLANDLRLLLESTDEGIYGIDQAGCCTFVNHSAAQMFGYTPEQLLGCNMHEAIHHHDREGEPHPHEECLIGQAIRSGVGFRVDNEVLWRRDGSSFPVELSCYPIVEAERIQGAVVTFSDITRRKQSERERERLLEQLETERARLNAIIHHAPIGILVANEAGQIVLANPAAAELLPNPIPLGDPCESLATQPLLQPDGSSYPPQALPLTRSARTGELIHNAELLVAWPGGSRRTLLVNSSPIRDHHDQISGAISVFQDITPAKEAELERQHLLLQIQRFYKELQTVNCELESQRAYLETILQHMPAGVLLAEAPSGKLMLGNQQVQKMLRHAFIPAANIKEYTAYKFIHPDGRPYEPEEHPLARTILTGEPFGAEEVDFLRGDGTLGTIRVSCAPLRDREGRLISAVATLYDITETKRLREELRQRAEELTRLNGAKDEFLAMLAHELRNPLAPILSALHILEARRIDADLHMNRPLEMIKRQVRHMSRLVDDLLDVSRITRGKIELRKEVLDLTRVVEQAIESSRPRIEANRHALTVELPGEPVWLKADPARLEQVVANLLNNAAKYTPAGGHIDVFLKVVDDEAMLRVRDNGVGIPPEMLTSIFELFSQVDRSLDRSQGGLGIGLTLVKRLVEMHEGCVQASSPGLAQGSEFVVRLPILVQMPRLVTSTQDYSNSLLPRSLRVLVVEDNPDTAMAMGEVLEIWGHEVRLAYDGPSAVELAPLYQPEVVLLDIGLPGMDGYQVARTLRQDPQFASALLIAITGYGQADDKRRAVEAGMDYHFTKPIDLTTLHERLDEFTPHSVSLDPS